MSISGFESVEVLATSVEAALSMSELAKEMGETLRGTKVWEGPIPENGSYLMVNPFVRMASPEYYLLRMANTMELPDAIMTACELQTRYCTRLTSGGMPEGEMEVRDEPHTTYERAREYLAQVEDTPEGMRAILVLDVSRTFVDAYDAMCLASLSAWDEQEAPQAE